MRFRKIGNFSGFHGWGDLLYITPEDADASLLQTVLREIEDSLVPILGNDPGLRVSPEERKKRSRTLRDFEPVSISKTSEGELIIQPMMMTPRGGGTGDPKDRVLIPLPNTNENFLRALGIAYSRCAVVYDR